MQDSIGFLISDVSRLMRRRFDERARLIGVTRTQWRVLKFLQRGEGINQGGLADLLEVEPITLCRMIDRLEEAGLVERRRDPADRRAWQIFLTERARPLLEELAHLAEAMLGSALQGVSPAEYDAVMATLRRIHSNLSSPDKTSEVANG
ncbi:DNA-binding MarR family transcriptional regulator [Sphingomonas sp. BE270]|uniref:MarR family winged helix-turn-helix transcriptional regulator n=1 Tax=unclassified Sphingomonas TaxID=196159 RepID=UPI00053ED9E8|nr:MULTISPECIES: MarR family transcriptional regulator [unclassified Sphingomonas]MDR6847071.1 DNA-binding MarR family transcriptional regulator [Sphingomonas sp. BE137]MDR7256672.1 DNA-binding MarR family transcriptional regulator [Sphingomonas sp. BE270]